MLIPTGRRARPAPAASQRPVLTSPPPAIHRRGPLDEASTRVQAIQPSGLPLAWRPPTEQEPLGLPPSFAPRRPRAGQRTSRWGQATEHEPGTTRSTSHQSILQSCVHSLRATSRRTAWSGSPGVDALVTALVLAAARPSVSAPNDDRTDPSAMSSMRACASPMSREVWYFRSLREWSALGVVRVSGWCRAGARCVGRGVV